MRKRKLVPLRPILERLGACDDALEWQAAAQCKTFAQAWERCPHGGWLAWLIGLAIDLRDGSFDDNAMPSGRAQMRMERELGRPLRYGFHQPAQLRALRESYSRVFVERVLYEFAKREGLS